MGEHTKEAINKQDFELFIAAALALYSGSEYEKGYKIARRIVACVNACAGIGTEWLEKNAAMLQSIVGDIQNVSCQLDDTKAQRDELLAAAKAALEHLPDLDSAPNGIEPSAIRASRLIRAAIYNAEKEV